MAGLTLEAANLRLETATSTQDIVDILKEISIASTGSKTVLYSGMSSDAEKATLEALKKNSNTI